MITQVNTSDKKLWKLIGLDNLIPNEIVNQSECSTVKLPERYLPCSRPSSIDQIRLFSSQPLDRHINKVPQKEKNNYQNQQMSSQLEVESCESQEEDDLVNGSPRSPRFPSLFKYSDALKQNIIVILKKLKQLKEQNLKMKRYVLGKIEEFNLLLIKQSQQSNQLIDKKEREQINCQKCDNNKKIAEVLTKQCWQLDSQVKTKQQQMKRLKQQLYHAQNNPIRIVQKGLYQERVQIVKRLKIQLQLITQQNLDMRISLNEVEEKLIQTQRNYQQVLANLKLEIEQIERVAQYRIEKLIQQKKIIESKLDSVSKQYEGLLSGKSRISFDDTKNNNDEDMYRSINIPSSSKLRISKKYDRGRSSMKNFEQKKMCEIFSRQKKRLNTETYHDAGHIQLNNNEKLSFKVCGFSDLETLELVNRRQESTMIKKKLKNPHLYKKEEAQYLDNSYGNALDSLASLRREVRRQIKRSNYI